MFDFNLLSTMTTQAGIHWVTNTVVTNHIEEAIVNHFSVLLIAKLIVDQRSRIDEKI